MSVLKCAVLEPGGASRVEAQQSRLNIGSPRSVRVDGSVRRASRSISAEHSSRGLHRFQFGSSRHPESGVPAASSCSRRAGDGCGMAVRDCGRRRIGRRESHGCSLDRGSRVDPNNDRRIGAPNVQGERSAQYSTELNPYLGAGRRPGRTRRHYGCGRSSLGRGLSAGQTVLAVRQAPFEHGRGGCTGVCSVRTRSGGLSVNGPRIRTERCDVRPGSFRHAASTGDSARARDPGVAARIALEQRLRGSSPDTDRSPNPPSRTPKLPPRAPRCE